MSHAPFRNIGIDTCARHQAAARSAQIVQSPVLHAAGEVEFEFECAETGEIGVRPSVVNTKSQPSMRGISANTFMAALDNGSVTSAPVLYRSRGIVQLPLESSSQVIALASVRRQAVSNKRRMNCPGVTVR